MYTLKDLKFYDSLYFFPDSTFGHTQEQANKMLVICNYLGRLSGSFRPVIFADIIIDILALRKRLIEIEKYLITPPQKNAKPKK